MRSLTPLLIALVLAGCADPSGPPPARPGEAEPTPGDADGAPLALRLEEIYSGLDMPLLLTHAGDGSGRHFIVEQGGRILEARPGEEPTLFLDVSASTRASGERGLLGLAFAPDFARSGRFYVSYTDRAGDSVVERRALGSADVERILFVEQPFANHNGGHLAFGPDGYLYYGLGDGGLAGDPQGNAQDPHAILGSLLRLDVSGSTGYATPPDNPYADGTSGAPEVWAKGLRNPWRFTFDRETGDLFIGDVGQGAWEEINHQPANATGGANYGWSVYEGAHRYRVGASPFSPVTNPVAEYSHAGGACSVTGGHVYRGDAIPDLQGTYLYADYCSGIMYRLDRDGDAWRTRTVMDTGMQVSSFGEDEKGELYVVDHGGSIHRIVSG